MDRRVIGYRVYTYVTMLNRAIGYNFPSGIVLGFNIIKFIDANAYRLLCAPYPECWGCSLLHKASNSYYSCILSYIKSLI